MAVVITAESSLGIELRKWDKPYHFEPYPKMLYRARKRPDGKVSVGEAEDRVLGGQPGIAESFSTSCQRIVGNEAEHVRAKEEGWRETPKEALTSFEAQEREIADAAAHRNWDDRNMGEKAKVEAEAVDSASMAHAPEVTQKPKRKYTRKAA